MELSVSQIIVLVPVLISLYVAVRVFYNLFLHPLRSFPGPLLARATILASQKALYDGRPHEWALDLHKQYGSVVRIAPNELSFIDAEVWKDVYSHRATAFQKDKLFYGTDPFGHLPGLMRADNMAHARQRKLVSHAFSDKALREQEPLLKGYVMLLVRKLTEAVKRDGEVDMMSWYNFTTFDIMADLTFGEPLHLLEDAEYTPWVRSLFGHVKLIITIACIRRWPLLDALLQRMIPAHIKENRKAHMAHSITRVDKRLAIKTDRPDIWTYVLRHSEDEENKGKGLAPSEMHSNGALFMLAGTETTATELSGLTYYLLTNPEKMQRLKSEVRGTFSSLDDMTMANLSQLEYLNACIEEGLRLYPPVPGGLPRVAPKDGAKVAGHWVPGGTTVSLSQYAAYHSPANFKNPDAFVPERWLPEGQKEYGSDHKDVVNAFSYGPRNCLGKNLANHEMRLVLASVVYNFDMELPEGMDGWIKHATWILWAKPPFVVKLKPVQV